MYAVTLGNQNIHLLTKASPSEVYFKLKNMIGTELWAKYTGFAVGPESDNYRLTLTTPTYDGTAGWYIVYKL